MSMMVLGTVEVKGKQYAIVETGEGGYINGVYSAYALAPVATVDKNIPKEQMAEVVMPNQ